jgi:hypothetical protein
MRKGGRVDRTRGEMRSMMFSWDDQGRAALEDPHLTHMLSSFPLTSFFGSAFSATSRMRSTTSVIVAACGREESEVAEVDLEESWRRCSAASAWRCSTVGVVPCHVAHCQNDTMTMSVLEEVDIKCITHDSSESDERVLFS